MKKIIINDWLVFLNKVNKVDKNPGGIPIEPAYRTGYWNVMKYHERLEDYLVKNMIDHTVVLTDPFEILDALRGNITGEYAEDLLRLKANRKTCSQSDYDQAHQMDQQP